MDLQVVNKRIHVIEQGNQYPTHKVSHCSGQIRRLTAQHCELASTEQHVHAHIY